jgi:cyclophilin family peptidyl-prolyl cis-trans isomerase
VVDQPAMDNQYTVFGHVSDGIEIEFSPAAPALDGKYTAFGRVIEGMGAVDAIEASPRSGETPTTRIELKTVRVEKR